MSDSIVALHTQLFGFSPSKAGTAYERIAAIVLATLGWQDVTHDVIEHPIGKLAEHQLDIVARAPSGDINRLLVECKDYSSTIGEDILNTLVGVRTQIGADAAAVITTKGFTKGARAVAVDEDVALIVLRHFDRQTEKGNFVMKVILTWNMMMPTFSGFDIVIGSSASGLSEHLEFALTGEYVLQHLGGGPAETLIDVIRSQSAGLAEGTYKRRIDFLEERLLQPTSGPLVPISALMWTETVHKHTFTTQTEAKGTLVLVLEQLTAHGAVASGRLVVSEDLYAWDIDPSGHVRARGSLAGD